jgi:hypothetical protein
MGVQPGAPGTCLLFPADDACCAELDDDTMKTLLED